MTTDRTIESPLAQMRKTGKIGGKPATAEATAPATPEQVTADVRVKKAKSSQREKLQVYISPDLAKWCIR